MKLKLLSLLLSLLLLLSLTACGMNTVYTIGYTSFDIQKFVEVLKKYMRLTMINTLTSASVKDCLRSFPTRALSAPRKYTHTAQSTA